MWSGLSKSYLYCIFYREWCQEYSRNEQNDTRYVIQSKSKKDIQKIRKEFGRENQVDAKRFGYTGRSLLLLNKF